MDKRIRDDKQCASVQVRMTRAFFLTNVANLVGEGAISTDALSGFSEDFVDAVSQLVCRRIEFAKEAESQE